jgi:hypothetical protein
LNWLNYYFIFQLLYVKIIYCLTRNRLVILLSLYTLIYFFLYKLSGIIDNICRNNIFNLFFVKVYGAYSFYFVNTHFISFKNFISEFLNPFFISFEHRISIRLFIFWLFFLKVQLLWHNVDRPGTVIDRLINYWSILLQSCRWHFSSLVLSHSNWCIFHEFSFLTW